MPHNLISESGVMREPNNETAAEWDVRDRGSVVSAKTASVA
jgi:hypothetical protein